jgi:hypothetical protein
MAGCVVSLFQRDLGPRDWSNDELSQLYRIKHALAQLNIAVEIDRGQSDEGDPWFVFYRAEGDVLVHIARIDSIYHLHAPGSSFHLCGGSFEDLTRAFINRHPISIPVERGGNIVFHPSAIFTALVVAAFFASDRHADATEMLKAYVGEGEHQSADSLRSITFGSMTPSREGKWADSSWHLSIFLNVAAMAAAFVLDGNSHLFPLTLVEIVDAVPVEALAHEQAHWDANSYRSAETGVLLRLHDHALDHSAFATNSADVSFGPGQLDCTLVKVEGLLLPQADSHLDSMIGVQVDTGSLWTNEGQVGSTLPIVNLQPRSSSSLGASRSGESTGHEGGTIYSGHNDGAAAINEDAATAQILTSSPAKVSDNATSSSSVSDHIWLNLSTLISEQTNPAESSELESSSSGSPVTLIQPMRSAADDDFYNDAAARTVRNFVHDNPKAEVVVHEHHIIVYDGLTSHEDSSPLVVKTWDFESGGSISIVGHINHPIHYEMVA